MKNPASPFIPVLYIIIYLMSVNGIVKASASEGVSCSDFIDNDGDGYELSNDCNDNDPGVYKELLYFVDADGDGFGSKEEVFLCTATNPEGYADNNGDCDDLNNAINSSVTDLCNNVDDNCDGVVDENSVKAAITPQGTLSYCDNVPVVLAATSGSGLNYKWFKGNLEIPASTGSAHTTLKRGNFYVEISNGICSDISPVTIINRLTSPQAYIMSTGNFDICDLGYVQLRCNVGTGGCTYQWLKGGIPQAGLTSRNITVYGTGDYSVEIKNEQNCSRTSQSVEVYSSCRQDNEALLNQTTFSIYPNPATKSFTIALNLNKEESIIARLELIDVLGQVVYTHQCNVAGGKLIEQITPDWKMPSGSYIARISIADRVYSQKLTYQK